jgi:hypothetical protein
MKHWSGDEESLSASGTQGCKSLRVRRRRGVTLCERASAGQGSQAACVIHSRPVATCTFPDGDVQVGTSLDPVTLCDAPT